MNFYDILYRNKVQWLLNNTSRETCPIAITASMYYNECGNTFINYIM